MRAAASRRVGANGRRLAATSCYVHLVDDHVDMAVRIGRLADSAMVATKVGMVRIVTAASPTFLDKHGVPATPGDLRDFPAVVVDGPMTDTSWRLATAGQATRLDVPLRPRLAVTTTEAAVDAAVHGVGIVRLLHYQVSDAVETGNLKLVLEDFEPEPALVHLVHATRGQMPLKLRRFIDFAAQRLREKLSELSLKPRRR